MLKRILCNSNNPTRKKQEKEAKETREDLLKASNELREKIENLERERVHLTEELKKLIEDGEAKAATLTKEIEELKEETESLRKLVGTSNSPLHSENRKGE